MANNLKSIRENENLTMKELAALVGVSENYIYMLESGIRTPGFKLAKKIADLFNKTVDEIFFDNENHTLLGEEVKPNGQPPAKNTVSSNVAAHAS